MSDEVIGTGAVIALGDGEHRIRFPIRNLAAIEAHFKGLPGMTTAMINSTTETCAYLLANAVIDGEHWTEDRAWDALDNDEVMILELAGQLQDALMSRFARKMNKDDPEVQRKLRVAVEAGMDPTKPETWAPAVAALNGSTGPA